MKVEQLIEELQVLPKGTEVCVVDIRKNLHHATEEPEAMGIEKYFEVKYYSENVNKPFAGLVFQNDDYNKDGSVNYEASIVNAML